MRDRVTALGGNFEIVSSGKGTIVKVVNSREHLAIQSAWNGFVALENERVEGLCEISERP
jgi:hypothetical protein